MYAKLNPRIMPGECRPRQQAAFSALTWLQLLRLCLLLWQQIVMIPVGILEQSGVRLDHHHPVIVSLRFFSLELNPARDFSRLG